MTYSTTKIYPIKRWDVFMFKDSITRIPAIYIQPDDVFLTFADKNNYILSVTISSSDTIYDGKTIVGVVERSANVPNFRPNFFKKTGWYVISLWADWHGYPPNPDKLGSVVFNGMNNINEEEVNKVRDIINKIEPDILKHNENETDNNKSKNTSIRQQDTQFGRLNSTSGIILYTMTVIISSMIAIAIIIFLIYK